MSYKHQYLFLTCAILFITFNVIAETPSPQKSRHESSRTSDNSKAKKQLFLENNNVVYKPLEDSREAIIKDPDTLRMLSFCDDQINNLCDELNKMATMNKSLDTMLDRVTKMDTRLQDIITEIQDQDPEIETRQEIQDQSTETKNLVLLDDSLDNDKIVKLERKKYENVDVTVGNMEENKQLSGLSTESAINRDLNQSRLLESINQFKANYEATMVSLRMHHQAIQSRVIGLNDEFAAVAAGDEKTAGFGIWGSSGFAVSKQGRLEDIASYKAKMLAVTIGVDIELNDKDILGIAYSNVRSTLRFSEALGKSRINSHVVSIYSQKDLGRNVFLQSVGSISGSTIKKRMHVEKKGKSYADSIRVEGNVNYRHACTSGIQLVPTIGLRYCHMQGGLYNEQGPHNYFLKVSGKSKKVLSGTIGSTVILNAIDINPHLKLIPTLQGSIERSFLASSNEVVGIFTSNERVSQEIKIDMPRASRLGYNIGAGIIVQSNNIKLQFSYNYYIQKKYKAHEGVAKLKLSL